jgi:hypothetical protein
MTVLPAVGKNNRFAETFFARLFFSPENIEKLQTLLVYLVHKNTGDTIDTQPVDAFIPIMRDTYFNYCKFPIDIELDMPDEQKQWLINSYKSEVLRLNEIVMRKVLYMTLSNLQQFKDYLKEVEAGQPIPEYAKNVSSAGTKTIPFSQI